EHLDLADHDWLRHLRADTPAGAQELRGEAAGGHDGRLLDRHRDEHVLTVDAQVHADAERQPEDADRVLDHAIGLALAKAALGGEPPQVALAQRAGLAELRAALGERKSIEAGNRAV